MHVVATLLLSCVFTHEDGSWCGDVTGALRSRPEEDGGVQGEAGHASSGRLRCVRLQEKSTEKSTFWYFHDTHACTAHK